MNTRQSDRSRKTDEKGDKLDSKSTGSRAVVISRERQTHTHGFGAKQEVPGNGQSIADIAFRLQVKTSESAQRPKKEDDLQE